MISRRRRREARSLSIVRRGVVETERVAGQQPGVEFGRVEPGLARTHRPARGALARRVMPRDSARALRAASHQIAFGRQQLGLMVGDQRVDDLAQRLALDHLRQIVERQIDAVVGDAALREIIGADALGAIAGADLVLALGGARLVELWSSRRRRAWRAASPSPWRGSCAASAPPAPSRRCRSACG